MKRALVLALALALIAAVVPAFGEAGQNVAEVGAAAPDFELQTLDGEAFRLSDHRGKVVYLNVWATWCPPCVAEIPDIQKLAEAYPDELVVIGVSVDDGDQAVRDFVADNGMTYAVAMDWQYEICGVLYPSQYIPYSAFITPDGVISSIDVGGLTYAQMVERCERAAGTGE